MAPLAARPSFARGGNGNGGGKPGPQPGPAMSITPSALTMAVGQQSTVSVTYLDNRGNVITHDRLTYYGCRTVVDTDPDGWSVISILLLMPYARQAQLTGKAAGKVALYATDGVVNWVTAAVTVQ